MDLSWEDAQTFLAVAECQSFSAAAKTLSVGQPTISRRIRNLETTLGQQLFIRGKQGAKPTEAATKLIPAAQQMARWASEFDHAALQLEQKPEGVVRIAAPPGIAVEHLIPFAASLKSSVPGIRLEILAGIEHIDLTRGMADFAIRTQAPTDPGLVALHRAELQMLVVGSTDYVAKLKQPCALTDLDWVSWAKPYELVAPRPVLERLIPNFTPSFTSDDYLVQKAAVQQGLGVMIVGRSLGEDSLEPGLSIIEVDIKLPLGEYFLVTAKSLQNVARVNLVIDELVKTLKFRAS